jgi:hypothetical protein
MDDYAGQIAGIARGHLLLAVCAVLYLAWWWVFFHPRGERPQGLEYGAGVACIIGAAIAGIVAVVMIMDALDGMPNATDAWHPWWVAVGAYVVLALVTARYFDRPVTTELVLIVGWAALEAVVLGALSALGSPAVMPLAAAVVAGTVVSLVCYVLYYRLMGMASFVDGCVPLAVVGVIGLAFALALGW